MTRLLASVGLVAILGVAIWQFSSSSPDSDDTNAAETSAPLEIAVLRPAPTELINLDGWMNTERTTLAEHRDTVTVVQFWTFGCFNCKATLDNMRALYDTYGEQGLEVIGVHAPEFGYEADTDNIAQALVDLDVDWPIALDTNKTNFRSWQEGGRRFWPRTYVIDSDGNIRFDHVGEGKYDELNATVAQLLAEAAA